MLEKIGPVLTKVTKVKGHATGEMVVAGQVRALDKTGNDHAHDAADFGRTRVPVGFLTQGVILLCYVAFGTLPIARVAVDEEGTVDPSVSSLGLFQRRRRPRWRLGTMPFCLVPPPFRKKIRLVTLVLWLVKKMFRPGHILSVFWLAHCVFRFFA